MKAGSLVCLYVVFCGMAAALNLGLQLTGDRLLGLGYWQSLSVGTAGGLALKYFLDKNYIFKVRLSGEINDLRSFLLYSGFGVLTTSVFWLVEWLGNQLLPESCGRYVGGAVGLALGYLLKYRMDRRWVFVGR